MTRRNSIILIVMLLAFVAAISYEYFLNPSRYWLNKAAEICTESDRLFEDFKICMANKERNKARSTGFFATDWDKVCNSYRKKHLLKQQDCLAAEAKYKAEFRKSKIE